MKPSRAEHLRSFDRLFAIVNAAAFALLMAWIALLHFNTTDVQPSRLVPSTFPETSRERTADGTAPDDEIATPEDYTLEDDAARTIDPVHQRARDLFRAGRAEKALALMRGLISTHPEDAVLRNDEGVYLSSLGDTDGATASFGEAVRISPSYARAHYNLGTLLLKAEDYGSALAALGRSLALNPYYGEARFNRALTRSKLGDTGGAVEDYEILTRSDQSATSVKAYYNLGLLHMRAGRDREALRAFAAALHKQADHTGARFNKALLLMRSGLEDEAMVEYEKLLEVAPGHPGALLNAGAYSLRRESWSAAVEYFERLLAVDPDSARANYNLGLCRARMGSTQESIAAFEAAIASDPAYAEARYNLGLAYRRAGRMEEAARIFRGAVELRPQRASYHYNLALAYFDLEDLPQSIASYLDALAVKPGYYRARYNLALAYLRADDYSSAMESFALAERLQPESYPAIYNRGVSLLKMNRPAEAEVALRAALDLQDTVEAGYNLGLALKRQGKLDVAIETFQAVLRRDPKHAASIERLAEVHSEAGSHEESLQKLVLLQKLAPDDPTAFNLGLDLFKQGNAELALRYFGIAVMGRGDVRRKSLIMQYQALKQRGEVSSALAVLEAALPEFPENEVMLRGLGLTLAEANRHEDAASYLAVLQSVDPGDATAFNWGIRLYRSKSYPTALAYFGIASQAGEPISAKAMNMRALTLRKIGDDTRAIASFRTALERFPHYGPLARNLSHALSDLGRHEEATEVLLSIASHESGSGRLAETLYLLGNEQLALGKTENGRESFERALEIDRDHSGARKALGSIGDARRLRSNP